MSGTFVAVAGRWDPSVAIVDLEEALNPENFGTHHAVRSRPRVTPDVLSGGRMVPAAGLPVSIAVDAARQRAFVVNHAGATPPDIVAGVPHGHPGNIAVLDLSTAADPAARRHARRRARLRRHRHRRPGRLRAHPGRPHLLVTSAEGLGTEDGGFRITVIDAVAGRKLHDCRLRADGIPARIPRRTGISAASRSERHRRGRCGKPRLHRQWRLE